MGLRDAAEGQRLPQDEAGHGPVPTGSRCTFSRLGASQLTKECLSTSTFTSVNSRRCGKRTASDRESSTGGGWKVAPARRSFVEIDSHARCVHQTSSAGKAASQLAT